MNGREDGTGEVVLVVVVGDAHVAVAVVVGIGVLALPHHRLIFVEQHDMPEVFAELFLLFDGKGALGKGRMHGLLRSKHLFEEGHKLALDEGKEFIVLLHRHPLFEFIEQNIVSFAYVRLLPDDVLALVGENVSKVGLDGCEAPAVLCLHKLGVSL